MTKKVCMIDVDDTLVHMFGNWKKWYEDKYNIELNPTNLHTNLDTFRYAFDFWRDDKLYNNLSPVEYSQEAIKVLADKYEIVFCSWCMIEHKNSKINFINKHYKKIVGDIHFIDTRSKFMLRPDVAIDDRLLFLYEISQFNPQAKLIQPYNEGYEIHDTNFKDSIIPDNFNPIKENWFGIYNLAKSDLI